MKKGIVFFASSVFTFSMCVTALAQDQNNTQKVSQAIVNRMEKTVELTPQQKEQLITIYDQSFKKQAEHRQELQNQIIGVIGEQNFNKYMKAEKAALAVKGKNNEEKAAKTERTKKSAAKKSKAD